MSFKFIHISDLHLGKNINGISMIDNGDQVEWVERFLEKVRNVQPDAVVIAGDIYDRSSPSGEAVLLFDHLLTEISKAGIPVMAIAGNHDSPERMSFAKDLLAQIKVYISGKVEKKLTSVTIPAKDGSDEITFWLMPYMFPNLVSSILEDDNIREYEEAARALLKAQDIDFSKKNVLIAHQNVTASGKEVQRGGSESMVGGVGQIDYSAFDGFTYVALGHIHAAYPVGRDEVRFCGTPLCYHFDELKQAKKGPLLVEIDPAGTVSTTLLEIEPLHPLRCLEGTYEEILENLNKDYRENEYLKVIITDQKLSPSINVHLDNLLEMRGSKVLEKISNFTEFSSVSHAISKEDREEKNIEELFVDFFREKNFGVDPDDSEMEIITKAGDLLLHDHQGEGKEPSEAAVNNLLSFVLNQGGTV